ncbi:MAG: ATP-binding protein [Desulfobacterales bacterium]
MTADGRDRRRSPRGRRSPAGSAAERRKAAYFQAIAEETGKRRLREMFRLTRLIERHREMEQRLLESEVRYRTVVENLAAGMLVAAENRIVFTNRAAAGFLGLSPEELLSDPDPFRHVHPEERQALRERHARRTAGLPVEDPFVFRLLAADGKTRWLEVTGTPIRWQGRPAALNFLIDVTERVRAAEREKMLAEQLHRAQKLEALGTLAGGIAHDFNNLMASALAYVSLMLCETDPSHRWYEPLCHIERQIRRGSQLTSRLLAHLRRKPERKSPVEVNGLIREVLDVFGRTRKDLRLTADLDSALPRILADESQIEQVLLNLFVNAADAMPGGGTLTVRTRRRELPDEADAEKASSWVELTVADDGVGMTPEIQERIFDPFFTTKEFGRGTGLGLATVFGIVKGHGGRIEVASRPGQGTRFTIRLPATAEGGRTTRIPLHATEPPPRRGRVLIVDDEPAVTASIARMLEKLGFAVLRATGGEEALELFSRHAEEIDLVVLDVVMPGMGGEAIYQRIREIRPQTRILVASGYDFGGNLRELLRGKKGGRFIQKPFTLEELSQAVAAVLSEP